MAKKKKKKDKKKDKSSLNMIIQLLIALGTFLTGLASIIQALK